MATVVTIKWGQLYSSDYVNRLYAAVKKNLTIPHRFVCFTEDAAGIGDGVEIYPLPPIDLPEHRFWTNWRKLSLFQNNIGHLSGDCLFLDLDLMIADNINCFFEFMPGKQCIIRNWLQSHLRFFKRRPKVGNSSVFRWQANTTQFILDKFYHEQEWALANFRPPQKYLTYALGEKYFWPESWVKSFKRHAVPLFPFNLIQQPYIPKETKILIFHGDPSPKQAIEGFKPPYRWHRHIQPAQWLRDYWQY